MTTQNAAGKHRQKSRGAARYLVSVAVAAAMGGAGWAHRAIAADPPAASDQTTASSSAPEPQMAEVMVTGSRIARTRDLDAPSPISTVGQDLLNNSSATGVESILNQQPQFVPQTTQFTSQVQATPTQSPGTATLNLRGLGDNRNLVLVDGQRWQPSNASLVVDINTIPLAAVESVETITGGASAVYGPDAIAGVVNFILKKDFQGLDVDVQHGESFQGDAGNTRVSVLMGMNSADNRGNVMIGLDWTKRDAIYQDQRSFYTNGFSDPNNVSSGFLVAPSYQPGAGSTAPSQAALDGLFPQAPAGTVGTASEVYFNQNGTPFVQQNGGLGYNGPINAAGTGRYSGINVLAPNTSSPNNLQQTYEGGLLSIPLQRYSLFGRGHYDITDDVTAYAQLDFNNSQVTSENGYAPAITIWGVSVPRYNTPGSATQDSSWLPSSLVSLLNSRASPNAPWNLYQVIDYMGPESDITTTNTWQATAGLKGKLPFRDWTWDIYGSQGKTQEIDNYTGLPSLQRLSYLDQLPDFGKGASISAPAGTPFGYGESCTSGLPVFQTFTPSSDCIQSIQDPLKTEQDLKQTIVEGYIQGMLMKLPAGEARFDLGATYRGDEFTYSPGNPVGAITDNPVGIFPSNYTQGDISVTEVYTELLVPVLKKLDLELGYRESDFNTAGYKDTYKAMFTWKATDELSFRGGYQQATRAPNVAELYTGATQDVVPFPQEDPCSASTLSSWGNVPGNPNRTKVQTLCEALIGNTTSQFNTQTYNAATYGVGPNGWTRQVPTFFPLEIENIQGNPQVKPETGKTFTLGAVITEPFGLVGFTSTIDLYQITIDDTIAPESAITIYNNCFNSDGTSNPTYSVTNPACQLIQRNPVTGDRASVTALFSNLGTLVTNGMDVAMNYVRDIGPGRLGAGTSLNYLNKYQYQQQPGTPYIDAKGTLDPVNGVAGAGGLFNFRADSHVQYTWQALTVGLGWEFLSSIKDQSASMDPNTTVLPVPSYSLFSFFSTYAFDKVTLRFGIDNLFDKQPPVVGNNPGFNDSSNVTNPGLYDPIGIRFYVGLNAKF
jgi:outer membrane receptor protein involved in Fe transport